MTDEQQSDEALADTPATQGVSETANRVLRGGSFSDLSWEIFRSAYRHGGRPGSRHYIVGFRPARTYDLSP